MTVFKQLLIRNIKIIKIKIEFNFSTYSFMSYLNIKSTKERKSKPQGVIISKIRNLSEIDTNNLYLLVFFRENT